MNDRVSCYTTKEIVHNKNHKNNDDIYETHQETCGIVWKCNFDPQCIVNASGWKMNKDNYFKRPGTLMLFYHSRAHNRKNWVPSILTYNVWLIFMGMKQKNQNSWLKKLGFSKSPILNIFLWKFHGLVHFSFGPPLETMKKRVV